ncbi:MAG: hypothetical protein AB1782_05535 [Cyanobacteriota bacterium]
MSIFLQNLQTNYLMGNQSSSSSALSFGKKKNVTNQRNINLSQENSKMYLTKSQKLNRYFNSQGDIFTKQQNEAEIINPDKVVEYKNIFEQNLKSEPNSGLAKLLKADSDVNQAHLGRAVKRTRNFSRYLKEDMVGFITPEGKHWFEGACLYIIKGTAGVDIPEREYVKYAKEFWGHLAKADKYWASDDFINYLQGLESNPGVNATIEAIRQIKTEHSVRNSHVTFGYNSDMKYIKKLLEDGCAYTGITMKLKSNSKTHPTLEHLFPHRVKGDELNDDCNYVLTIGTANCSRGDIPLTAYLKGWNAVEFNKEFPRWRANIKAELRKNVEPEVLQKRQDKRFKKELKEKKHKFHLLRARGQVQTEEYKALSQRVEELEDYFKKRKAEIAQKD